MVVVLSLSLMLDLGRSGFHLRLAWVPMLWLLPGSWFSEGVIDTFVDQGAACDARIHGEFFDGGPMMVWVSCSCSSCKRAQTSE